MTSFLIIMGVSGAGKSTIGLGLAEKLGWIFRDADDFHPPENVAKMKSGLALNDEDRAPWLASIAAFIDKNSDIGVVVTCSALKRKYRDTLMNGRSNGSFVYLEGSEELIFERMQAREGHFMPLSLLQSQLATLEPPTLDEKCITVSIEGEPSEIVARVLSFTK